MIQRAWGDVAGTVQLGPGRRQILVAKRQLDDRSSLVLAKRVGLVGPVQVAGPGREAPRPMRAPLVVADDGLDG